MTTTQIIEYVLYSLTALMALSSLWVIVSSTVELKRITKRLAQLRAEEAATQKENQP